jgi:ArsR family transcriptional regulator, arsenate/arsenite/antimonite-responsive transcriptional repressor
MAIEEITKALGDESRRKIIELLKEGELPATAIFEKFSFAAPTISRHLSVLKEAGLVQTRRNGVFIFYTLNVDKLNELQEWLSPFLPKKTEKMRSEPREKPANTIRIPKENPFDKFQSEF